nr:MAG: wsv026-like protein [Chiromantes dehaani nimavirus]
MIQRYLFMDGADAALIGTSSHKDPTFHLYESENLQSVGLCDKVRFRSFPRYLPRPFDINSVQATAVQLALIQYFDSKGWKNTMDVMELVTSDINRKSCPNKKAAGGFIIGDGTGVGKTRELAAFLVSVVLYEKAMRDTQCQFGPSIFGNDSCEVINAIRDGSWKRSPCFIWLTCSRTLFNNCQDGMREVVTNSKIKEEGGSWKPFPDKPSRFKGGGRSGSMSFLTKNIVSENPEEVYIRFYTLQDVKDYLKENRGSRAVEFFTAAPTILFMTYADLNANLEFVLKFITGGTDIDSNVMVPIDNFVTAILCDEFHQPKNISDAFRGELEKMWAEEDKRVLSNSPRPPNPSISELVGRFKMALSKDKQFNTKRFKSKKGGGSSSSTIPTSTFLALLRQSDSFRLFLEVIKYDTFCVMASATPFQSNADLHSIDHILRRSIPAYTSIATFSGPGISSTPDAIAENSEYATVFLEQAVKLLRNRGQLVSRCISIANVECSVVNCNTTPLQKYAMDELSSYCLNARQVLIDCKELGAAIADLVSSYYHTTDDFISRKKIKEVVKLLNSFNTVAEEKIREKEEEEEIRTLLGKMDKRFTALLVEDEDVAYDGLTTIETVLKEAAEVAERKFNYSSEEAAQDFSDIMEEEEEEKETDDIHYVFTAEWFKKLRRQYFINTASISVAACKSALLSVKAHSVAEAVKRLRISPERKKVVMSLEQTGDSFLTGLAGRVFCAPTSLKKTIAGTTNHGIVDVNVYDSSPLANTIFAGYRLLCRAVAMATTIKLKIGAGKTAYLMLVPAPPPAEPLVALSGNSLDTIVQRVGEANHAEITNRRLCSRITRSGMMVIRPNQKTSNTNQCIYSFNNTKTVDVMMLGPKGSTGLSLHDSKFNAVAAKRIHCLLDVPYNAIGFLQTIGRTHRNGQMSVPHFLIFSTDSPSERRFFDSLENRVKDSKAGTFADRYSNNSISINTSSINREQFLDKGLILKTMGYVIRIITSDMSQVELIEAFSKMMLPIGGGAMAFVEGLNGTNSLFVEILLLSIHITLVALGQQQRIRCLEYLERALQFAATLKKQALYAVAACAAKFAFSNLCLNLVYHEKDKEQENSRLKVLSEAAAALIDTPPPPPTVAADPENKQKRILAVGLLPARGRNTSLDIFSDLVSGTEEEEEEEEEDASDFATKNKSCEDQISHIVSVHRPVNMSLTISLSSKVSTVRILGTGKKEGVITVEECQNLSTTDMVQLIPVVAASSVINTLCKENPGLVFKLYNASVPHKQFRKPFLKTSYILSVARKLSTGSLDFRQFQNNFFSPKNESQLMLETFFNVKSIMARDDRLDGLCETRMNSVMGASYVHVRRKPKCVFISKLLKNRVLRRHVVHDDVSDDDDVVSDDDDDEKKDLGSASGNSGTSSSGEGHDLDIILCNGSSVTLTKENSAFVKEHIDSFVAGNLIGTDGSILQLCFDNCNGEFDDMPKFCLYDPSPK